MFLAACSGGTNGDVSSDEPPWGLDQIDIPDTEETVAEVMAAFPNEIAGLARPVEDPTQ